MSVRRLIVGLVAIFLWVAHDSDMASGQSSELREAYSTYSTLYEQGRYSEAEPFAKEAVRLATEAFGPDDRRLATTLNILADLYHAQGKYAEAKPLFKRSLAIWEKALGPEHPNVATGLEDYALLLRITGRTAEADKLEARAEAIRAKRERQNR